MGKTTCIRNANWVIAWDSSVQQHAYLRDADVVFEADTITFVGKGFEGPLDAEVDGSALCVMPGLVDIHSHPSSESSYRGIREEHGVPEMYMSGLYERGQAFSLDEEGLLASTEVAYCELLKSGVTSIFDQSNPYPGWIDLIVKSGLRGFLAPGYASSSWYLTNRHQLKYRWDEQKGRTDFADCLSLIDRLQRHECGRLSGVVFPKQIDTCTEELLRDSVQAARERNLPIGTHASQSVNEFLVMVDRYGKTPVQWAHEIGLLGPNCILGHVIFVDEHSWLHWATRDDIRLLAETGTTVAHCPTPFARYGQILEHFGKYLRTGVNMAIGTDTAPHNILEEMRSAAVLARIAAGDITSVTTADIFHAATIGGAKALLRDDLGRLSPGCKADIVLVDLNHLHMQPARDPLRCLVYTAAERAVRDVYVDGNLVVKDHEVITLNHAEAVGRLAEAQTRMEAAVPGRDYAGRSALEIAPMSLPWGDVS
jgi:cytosine/adenosine deaminase-related metal-dependent hydrolase